ncbi:MAG: dihydrolipoyl dehydrogenase [Acidimicrobiales bacterium]|jgi:dihydrolipoamide dehydrogenase
MNTDRPRELVVLGGGPGGYVAAIRAAQLGVATTLVEEANLGGVCLNEGCVPSKALIHDADEVQHDLELGLIDDDQRAMRFAASKANRGATIGRLRQGVAGLLRANGVETVTGRGTLADAHTMRVVDGENVTRLRFDELIVATGSEALVPPGMDVDGKFVLTARDILELDERPGRAVVVGGGYIGLELACALQRFGTEIVVVEATERILAGIEPLLAEHLGSRLEQDGIDVRLNTTLVEVSERSVLVHDQNGDTVIDTDAVVVAVGRRPRTSGIGLEHAGVVPNATGHLDVDDQLRTAVGHIRAIGDVTNGPALAHRAMAQGRAAAASIANRPGTYRPAAVPAVVFTTPEIATVGLRLDEALGRGVDARQVRFPLAANARGLTLGGDGFGLLVHEVRTGLVLGAHLLGPGVGELIGTATLAIEMGAVIEDLAGTIFPHPTISEVFGELADEALGLPTHAVPSKKQRE